MSFSFDELCGVDLDWFAIDCRGHLAHFASGGGMVPEVAKKVPVRQLKEYFRQTASPQCKARRSEGWNTHARIDESNRRAVKQFFEDFFLFANRGLFSFTATMGPVPFLYYRVAVPASPLRIDDLPDEMCDAVRQVTFTDLDFAACTTILPIDLGDCYGYK